MFDPDIEAWLKKQFHEGYYKHIVSGRASTLETLRSLGVPSGSELEYFYLNHGAGAVSGWYELNEPEQLREWTEYAHDELEVATQFIALTGIEGDGITLYDRDSGAVFDVEYGQFDSLGDGSLQPVGTTFQEFLRWCMARETEEA
jgi:hypothetical protein